MQSSVIFKPLQPKIKKKSQRGRLGGTGYLGDIDGGKLMELVLEHTTPKTKLPVHYAEDRESQRMPVNKGISALSRKEACRCLFDCTSLLIIFYR